MSSAMDFARPNYDPPPLEEYERCMLIKGYKVELELRVEFGEHVSSCFITKGSYCSSLAFVQDQGGYENDQGDFRDIYQESIDAITAWAEENGY